MQLEALEAPIKMLIEFVESYHLFERSLHLTADEVKKVQDADYGIRVPPSHLLYQIFIDLLAGLRPEIREVPAPEFCTIWILARQAVVTVEVEVVARCFFPGFF